MKRILFKALSFALCALVLALGLSGVLYSCHCCERVNCAICLAIGEALSVNRVALAAALLCAIALTLPLMYAGLKHPHVMFMPATLVSMRTMLLS